MFEFGGDGGGRFRMVFVAMMRGNILLMMGICVVDGAIDMLGP